MRSFIAVDINNEEILSKIEVFKEQLENFKVKLKLVETENLHITLRFLGEIDDSYVNIIKDSILGQIKYNSFIIKLEGLGAFPSINKARVVWIGITQGFEHLKQIKNMIDQLLIKSGFKLEKEDFTPHLTIARVKSYPTGELKEFLQNYLNYEIGLQNINSIKLKKSTLTRQGPIYEDIAEVKLI
ncbi:MAG: RNA 2',3'-cyclic phosphodiesterase [Caldisphaera sp.]|jgi:2'-5' RNA ligase|nr:RNA 2',3'-cyclic phosphodiesterase [Caldisphaera sp.]PMP60968.1 MAG: RNA 2',3'-cyclic phosphodiesterase [Caldisphaera sp.]